MTSQPIRLSTNFMTLIPSLTFTDNEWFPWSICNGCGMPAGNAYPSGHLVPSPFWDLLMLQLLRPNSSNLPCLYSTFHLENPLVLSRFCLFRVPRNWTGSVQMKSSMTFIRGNRCIERQKDNFKNGGEVKCLKECALALNHIISY